MTEKKEENFNEFALSTSLFKGRPDLYFCYLKLEKLAVALAYIFRGREISEGTVLENLIAQASVLPGMLARFAGRMSGESHLLSAILEILSLVRLAVGQRLLNEENAKILLSEYETIARKATQGSAISFLTLEDLEVPELPTLLPLLSDRATTTSGIKRQQLKGHTPLLKDKGHSSRTEAILKIINENKRVSIKDISKVIRDCSEKTIQRELISLMNQGLVRKEGQKRWSVYLPAV